MKYTFNILLLFFTTNCFCQVWTNNGSVVNILPGTELRTNDLENNSGIITNNGIITLNSNLTNLASINGNGNYTIGNNWNNSGTFTPGTGIVTFNGGMPQNVFSSSAFTNVTINKTSGSIILLSEITINGVLTFISGKIQTGSNKVSLSATGSITGSSQSTGWVSGNLQKNIQIGNTLLSYEVGDNNFYTPATIAFNGVTTGGNLTTHVTAADHPNLITSGIDINKSVNKYFTFSNNGVVFTDANLTLNWQAADVDAGASTANFIAAKYNGSSWSIPSIASPNPTSIQVNGITTFGDFAIGEPLSALPVKLSNLKAYTKNRGIQVEWLTQSEINMARYEVERSANGQQFLKAGEVQANGNSSLILNYGWFDSSPFNNVNYYRIKSIEKTGGVSYSPIVKVNISTGRSEIIFYPNPVIGNTIKLQLNNIPKGYYIINLINNLGQQVYRKAIDHTGTSIIQNIDVHNLVSGLYYVNISGGGINFTKQVIKK